MLPRYISHKRLFKDQRGITLVELLIVLALLGIILGVVGSMFITGIRSFNTADDQVESYSSGRMAFLNLERQIKRSEEILIKDGTVYIQDMDTLNYYNYYTLNNHTKMIMKHKVDKANLNSIGEGSTSQFAANISDFELIINDSMVYLKIITDKEGKKIELSSNIRVGVDITNK